MPTRRTPKIVRNALQLMALALIAAFLFGAYKAVDVFVAPQNLPWKPLDVNAQIGLATKTQLFKVSLGSRTQCIALLQDSEMDSQFDVLEPKAGEGGCGWRVALETMQSRDVRFSPSEVTTLCPLAAANYIWLTQVSNIATEILGSPLSYIHHYGTYSCRNVAGTSRRSEHAYANAWDINAFELEDGRVISVLEDWKSGDDRAAFLRDVRDSACKLYRVVLSPDYNAAHADHFHLDMGPSTTCR